MVVLTHSKDEETEVSGRQSEFTRVPEAAIQAPLSKLRFFPGFVEGSIYITLLSGRTWTSRASLCVASQTVVGAPSVRTYVMMHDDNLTTSVQPLAIPVSSHLTFTVAP